GAMRARSIVRPGPCGRKILSSNAGSTPPKRRSSRLPTRAGSRRPRRPDGSVRLIGADEVGSVLSYGALADALPDALRGETAAAAGHHHTTTRQGSAATLLLMPAWTSADGSFLGCKLVTVFPDNAKRGHPSLYGLYVLLSGETGEPLAVIEARTLTAWR